MKKVARTGLLGMLFGSALSQLALPAVALAQSEIPAPASSFGELPEPVAPVTSRLQIGLGGSVGYTTFTSPFGNEPLDQHSLSGGAELSATVFLRRLVDDGTPLSLQPFLQRVGTFQFGVTGGGFDSTATQSQELLSERQQGRGGGFVSIDAYVRRFLAIGAGFSASYAALTDYLAYPAAGSSMYASSSALALSSSVWIGMRLADTRIDLSYAASFSSTDQGPWQVPFWGGVSASVRTVIRQYVDLSVRLGLINQGAAGELGATLYPDQNLAVFVALFYGRGALYPNDPTQYDDVGGSFGGTMWFSRRVGASLSYSPRWTSGSVAALSHIFALDLFLRT